MDSSYTNDPRYQSFCGNYRPRQSPTTWSTQPESTTSPSPTSQQWQSLDNHSRDATAWPASLYPTHQTSFQVGQPSSNINYASGLGVFIPPLDAYNPLAGTSQAVVFNNFPTNNTSSVISPTSLSLPLPHGDVPDPFAAYITMPIEAAPSSLRHDHQPAYNWSVNQRYPNTDDSGILPVSPTIRPSVASSGYIGASVRRSKHQRYPNTDDGEMLSVSPTIRPSVASPRYIETSVQRRKHEARFLCDICGQDFTAKHNLKFHLRSHRGEKVCCERCGKEFSVPCSKERHKRASCPVSSRKGQ